MDLDRDKFARALNTSFILTANDGRTVDIDLVEVTEVKKRTYNMSFSILFRVPKNYTVEQGLYDLENEITGPVQLFLVPVSAKPEGIELEAVFNILLEKESDPTG